jgi:hypothetical protein
MSKVNRRNFLKSGATLSAASLASLPALGRGRSDLCGNGAYSHSGGKDRARQTHT